jgi:K+-sensing histidine kinase KdpD
MASDREPHEPACMVAHNLKSKLAAIVGRCDLLNERRQSAESRKHIAAIREIAESTIKELIEHQQTIEAEKRKAG